MEVQDQDQGGEDNPFLHLVVRPPYPDTSAGPTAGTLGRAGTSQLRRDKEAVQPELQTPNLT